MTTTHERAGLPADWLQRLLAGLSAVRSGDFSTRLPAADDPLMDQIAAVFNGMNDQLALVTSEVTRVAREVGTEGRLGGQAEVPGLAGTWKDLTDSVNSMAGNLTGQVRDVARVATAVARGDLGQKITVDVKGEMLELKNTINTMVDQLSSFAAEVTRVAREVGSEGRLGGQAEVEGVSGTWKRLTENVNELAGNLTRQVRAIAGVASAVATGDLTRSISVEAQGEVAELKDNINAMVRSLRETTRAYQEQGWLQSNLARIAGLMQGHRDLTRVAELVMDELIPLVGAQHGTFFLADTDGTDTRLRLIAGYGLRADIEAPSQFRLGQSLIGQVARTKKPIVVDDLPTDYVKISSGLGEAAPVNLMVLPIVFEDRVLGVIEAGSFSRFTKLHRDFLEQLMETIGVNVNAITANSRTDALLAESQRLAAELQARTGELQARQEELQRSNADLEDKAAQLARQNRDIEIKNVEIEQGRQELEERARQLDLASRYKSEFLANMSHELRTPLNSLLILARLLGENPDQNLTPKQVEYAQVIHSSGTDLLQLINDVLDLSRVEAGQMVLNPEPFALSGLLEDLRAVFRPLTTEKGLDFVVGPPAADVPGELYSDRQRLRQILHNLLSNAVKFTERGRVELAIAVAGQAEVTGPGVAFAVTDTGVGISEQNLEVIFGAFKQGDGTISRRHGGTGLGLAICREFASQLGGRITAASVPGHGSTFTLFLPVSYPGADEHILSPQAWPAEPAPAPDVTLSAQQEATVAGHETLRGRNVLIVDDDLRNAFAISSILELYGMTVRHAPDGRTGIDMLRGDHVDVVLMDVMMPEMDGYATTRSIRDLPEFRDLPVIAVTARAMHGDRDKSIAAGATDYVTKPVDAEELLACMERWIGPRQR
jgi:signal transduction histidine kinase/HAMP domain-containing protein/ActR/RegA family two-component response regulator